MADEVTTEETTNLPEGSESVQDNKDPGYMAAVKADLRDKYGDELRQYENINPIIEDYFNLKAKDSDAIFKPKDGASEEEVALFKEKMGIPKEASGYELSETPKELGDQKEFNVWFKDMALKTNLSKDQAKAVFDQYNSLQVQAYETQKAEAAETEKNLRTELGSGYDEAISNVQVILQKGGQDLVDYLNETGVGNDPRFIKAMAKLGSVVSEDSIGKTKATGATGSTRTLAERMYPTQGV